MRSIIPPLALLAILATPLSTSAQDDGSKSDPDPDEEALAPLLVEDAKKKKKGATRRDVPWADLGPDVSACSPDEIGLLRDLRGRSEKLDRRERELDVREAAVKRLEDRAAEQVGNLEKLRADFLVLVGGEADRRTERVEEFAKMVAGMKAKKAAPVLAEMNEDTALLVLSLLNAKQAGKVLAAMPPAEARRLGERYAELPDPRTKSKADIDAGDTP